MSFLSKNWVFVFVLLVLTPLVFFSFAKTFSITGAVIYSADVKPEVEQLVMGHPLTRLAAAGSKVCILIDDGSDSLSFSVVKNGKDDFNVSESVDKYCGGYLSEDFILEYVSYDAFKKEVKDNSCDSFKSGWKGDSYYFLISKQVKKGGAIVCDDYFKNTYCGAMNYCYTPEEISAYKLDCCVDYSPSVEEAAVFEELAAEGISKGSTVDMRDKPKPVETVSTKENPSSSFDLITWVGLPLIIVVLVIFVVLLKGGVLVKKPVVNPQIVQLQGYVVNTVRMGYNPNQVYSHLLQQGWPKDIVDHVFQNIYKLK
jgi:hypothetical protein